MFQFTIHWKKRKFIEACFEIDRNLRQFDENEVSNQYRQFLNTLKNATFDMSIEDLEKSDPKEIIKTILKDKDLYTGIEIISQACVVGCIKISVVIPNSDQ